MKIETKFDKGSTAYYLWRDRIYEVRISDIRIAMVKSKVQIWYGIDYYDCDDGGYGLRTMNDIYEDTLYRTVDDLLEHLRIDMRNYQ